MKILLIYPTANTLFEHPSLGVMYIASALRDAGHYVTIIEGGFSEIVDKIRGLTYIPNIIGITCMTPLFDDVIAIIGFIRHNYSNNCPKIVAGGAHATIMPETLIDYVDCIIKGEGERAMVEIADNGISDKIVDSEIVLDLDEISFPARDLVDSKYLSRGRCAILGSRGCPRNCSFCQPTLRKIFGNKTRYRSPENICEEMLLCQSRYNVSHFEFFDDCFTFNREWVFELCSLIEDMGITFNVLTRTDMVDVELFTVMEGAGLRRVAFGIESGSQKILNSYRKGTTVEKNAEAIGMCKEAGVNVHALFMVGSPQDSRETIEDTKIFIKNTKPDTIFVSITTPFPHTFLYDECIEKGLIGPDDWKDMDCYRNPTIRTEHLTEQEVLKEKYNILRSFYARKILNPVFVYNFLKNRTLSYSYNVVRHVIGRG